MAVGWLFLIATVGSSIWVFFDAPRHGLSRAWSLGCFFFWVAIFPWYLRERARADYWLGDNAADGHARRGLADWFSLPRIVAHRRAAAIALVVALPLTVLGAWQLRLLFRGPYMLFLVRHPALTTIPLLAGATAFLAHLTFKLAKRAFRKRAAEGTPPEAPRRSRKRRVRASAAAKQDSPHRDGAPRAERRPRYSLSEYIHGGWRGRGERPPPLLLGPAMSFLVCGALGFGFAGMVTASWTGAAIYEKSDYGPLTMEMLRGGQARVKPYEVAQRQSENGLNSPTERPTNLHIAKVEGDLLWTSVRDPGGFFRVLSKPTKGVMSVAANLSAPGVRQSGPRYDSDFRYGPGMRISENLRWQVYKRRCYSCDVPEMTGVPTPRGPVVIAPYIRYEGNWFVRRPILGGVYVVHPDGRIDDLSPEHAARIPFVRESGRLFPEALARRIAEAYQFKRGIWNRLFLHTEQLEVAHTEQNPQPFLQDFGGLGPQWVTTLKPHGGTFTTAGVMTTDAATGRTRVWLVPRSQSLIGNQRALDIVRGESFPGIVFSQASGSGSSGSGASGRFRVVEPRQVFPRGRLQFLLSIIPDAANRVTMSVVIDAESQRVSAKLPATPEGDADLLSYLGTGRLPGEADDTIRATDGGQRAGERTEDPGSTLRRLLGENRAEQRRAAGRISDLKAQERDLLRLLEAAGESGDEPPRERSRGASP